MTVDVQTSPRFLLRQSYFCSDNNLLVYLLQKISSGHKLLQYYYSYHNYFFGILIIIILLLLLFGIGVDHCFTLHNLISHIIVISPELNVSYNQLIDHPAHRSQDATQTKQKCEQKEEQK